MISLMFHSTAEACCEWFFIGTGQGAQCQLYDRGCTRNVLGGGGGDNGGGGGGNNNNIGGGGDDDGWDSNRACRTPGWHADMGGSKDGCTNDDNVSLHFIVMRS